MIPNGDWSSARSDAGRESASVERETLAELVRRHGLARACGERLRRLLCALAAEPRPPTTIHAPADAVTGHVADGLSGLEAPELAGARTVADIGSGAGFPGLVLAIALPAAEVDLIESSQRSAAVIDRLREASGALNARVLPCRAESWAAGAGRESYEAVTARALGSLALLVEYAAPLLRPGGSLVAWKGARDPEEEQAGRAAAALAGMSPTRVVGAVPFAGAHSRHLHIYRKVAETPAHLPRRPGAAAKRPLA